MASSAERTASVSQEQIEAMVAQACHFGTCILAAPQAQLQFAWAEREQHIEVSNPRRHGRNTAQP